MLAASWWFFLEATTQGRVQEICQEITETLGMYDFIFASIRVLLHKDDDDSSPQSFQVLPNPSTLYEVRPRITCLRNEYGICIVGAR